MYSIEDKTKNETVAGISLHRVAKIKVARHTMDREFLEHKAVNLGHLRGVSRKKTRWPNEVNLVSGVYGAMIWTAAHFEALL